MVTRKFNTTGVTSRGPTLDDCNFTLASQTHETVITGSEGEAFVEDDINLLPYTDATVDYDYEVLLTPIVNGYTHVFESLDPDVATIDSNGRTTRVGDGIARIIVKTPLLTKRIDLSHTRTGGQTSNQFVSWVAGSLAKECSDAIDLRIAGKTPSVAKPLYTTQDHTSGIYVRNTNCWAADLDLTCISPWNSSSGARKAGTLISPRHIAFANHYLISNGSTVRFVTNNGVPDEPETVVDMTLVSSLRVGATDIRIGILNADVPESISFAKILPYPILDYLPHISRGIPILQLDQEEKALVADWDWASVLSTIKVPTNATRLSFYEKAIAGDSGNGWFVVADDELILESQFYSATSGPSFSYYKNDIEATMTTLGGGYGLTVKSLAAYPTY